MKENCLDIGIVQAFMDGELPHDQIARGPRERALIHERFSEQRLNIGKAVEVPAVRPRLEAPDAPAVRPFAERRIRDDIPF